MSKSEDESTIHKKYKPISWETCLQVKKQQLKSDIEQWTGSKLGKDYI